MAEHKVNFKIPQSELGKAAAEFKAYQDGNVVGTLKIRKGGIEWFPKWKSKISYKFNWDKFAKRMQKK